MVEFEVSKLEEEFKSAYKVAEEATKGKRLNLGPPPIDEIAKSMSELGEQLNKLQQ